NGSMEIAGEFVALAAARESDIECDAILVAGGRALPWPSGQAGAAPALDDDGPGRRDRQWPVSDDVDEEAGFDESLTPREIQVLELLTEGLQYKAITRRLWISDQIVKLLVSSISGQLDWANRPDD